ncbi:MAG: DUF5317 domain-containing protein, partial [Candidatus Bipolaricaulota bacterium]
TIANLENIDLSYIWLVPLSLVIQLLIFPLFAEQPVVPVGTGILHVLSYIILAFFVLANLKVWGMPLMGAGMAANLLAITANGGYMPASPGSLLKAGEIEVAYHLIRKGTYGNVINMNGSNAFEFLGDWLYLPGWFPFSTAFSLGDLLVVLGLLFFFGAGMRKREELA